MLLAVDIGNTSVALAGIENGSICFEPRFPADASLAAPEYAAAFREFLYSRKIQPDVFHDCIISSVVPRVCDAVWEAVFRLTGISPMTAGPSMDTGLVLCVDSPGRLGVDRIVTAVDAADRLNPPLLVIDMGTATTVDVLEPGNRFLGGLILPGVRTALNALSGKAAQLPFVNLEAPEHVIGRNTDESMRSGILYGNAAMLDGIIDRIADEIGHSSALIATGGMAQSVIPLCRHAVALEQQLLFHGLYVLYQRNRSRT